MYTLSKLPVIALRLQAPNDQSGHVREALVKVIGTTGAWSCADCYNPHIQDIDDMANVDEVVVSAPVIKITTREFERLRKLYVMDWQSLDAAANRLDTGDYDIKWY